MTNTLFWDIESHDAELIWDMDPDEFFRLGQFSWNRDKKIELTDSRKELIKQIRKADCVVAHNQHHFDLTAVFGKDSTEPLQMAHDRKVFDTMVHATLVNQAPPKFQNRAGHTFYTEKNVGAVQKWFGLDQQCFALHLEGKIGDLKALAKKYGGFGLIPLDDPEFTAYAEQDVHAVRELAIRLKMMGGRDHTWRYAWREQMLWAIDAQNSRNGFTVDRATAQARYDELHAERDETMQMLVENYNFPTEGKQPWRSATGKQAIFDALADAGITPETRPDWKKTDKGNLSLGGEAVLELTEGTSVEDLGRGLATLLGQRSLAELALKSQKSDGKAHPKITRFQTSGRTSVTEPGLTVWTARGPGAVEKRYFTASPGRKLVELDYSNADARIVAALSGDEKYAERFEPGADGHEINGRAVYGDELYDSDPKFYRQQAKLQGHAWAYRVGPKGLAKQTGLPEATTKHFITTMNETYHQVVRWQNRASNDGEYGFVINEWGRVLKVNPERSYTQAPALLGQSGTREIVADALIRIYEAKPEVITWLVAQVHDALVWDIPEDALDWAVPFIKEHMEDVVEPKDGSGQRIEFPVEAGEPSDNWFLCSHA